MTRIFQPATPVAAFFDVDGTILAPPSLERRFLQELRDQRAIPMKNYFLWLAHAARIAPRGIAPIVHANKMYLRGVRADRPLKSGASVPKFFPQALKQVAWHAAQGHAVVLVTGTLAPLASEIALVLALRLAIRGTSASVGVCATRLEEIDGRWTGRIVGDAMFGEAKACAMRHLAANSGFDLARCYAYGDTATDRWMLGAVGRPAAVNPSRELQRIARLLDWPVLWWTNEARHNPRDTNYAAIANAKTETLG
jgi:HAD superfamily hydrolase (TIGR01490 family)